VKKLIECLLFLCLASATVGDISIKVYLPDGEELAPIEANPPFISYPPVIVGIKLAIVIDSNTADYWSGSLAVTDANMDYGVLSCRDSDTPMPDCLDSVLPAAGDTAIVGTWLNFGIRGYDLYPGSSGDREAGQWFVIDYTPTAVGAGSVNYYDHEVSYFDPCSYLHFPQIRTPDLDGSRIVDFFDYAMFSAHWHETDCEEPSWCEGVDLDGDLGVDFTDVSAFAYYWLKTIDPDVPPYDPRAKEEM